MLRRYLYRVAVGRVRSARNALTGGVPRNVSASPAGVVWVGSWSNVKEQDVVSLFNGYNCM
jgi:hypothetical protein